LINLFDRPVLVLLYHRVTTLSFDPQLLAVSPNNFRAHLQFLKNNFPLVRFEEDWSKIDKPAIVITFDDCYADNVLEALPIIEEIEVPTTFFVSTGTIGTRQEFWWDELEHLVLEGHDFQDQFVLEDSRFGQTWPTTTATERRVLFEEIQPPMRKVDAKRRESWLRQLRQWAKTEEKGCEAHRAMTVEELQRLGQSRWATVGAHTVTHSALSYLKLEEQRQEIIGAKGQLESWLAREVTVFSYPFGTREDYTQATVDLCRRAGFVKAAANFPAQIHSWTDNFQIPRQLVRDWPLEVFAEKLKGFWVS
jgi:peptidoglycan/xylan/chitin deacetylase (PgdA/CDA1 family)